jgi:DNA-directed RNA polymerase alpha subunit
MTTSNITNEFWKEINKQISDNRDNAQKEADAYNYMRALEQQAIREYWTGLIVSTRFVNCMTSNFIRDLKHLSTFTAQDLLITPNMGKITLREVRHVLKENGMSLADEDHLSSSSEDKATPANHAEPVGSKLKELLSVQVLISAYILRESGWTVVPPPSLPSTV